MEAKVGHSLEIHLEEFSLVQHIPLPLTDGYGHRSVFFKAQIFLFKVAANKTKSWPVDSDVSCVCVCVFQGKDLKKLDVFMLLCEKGLKGKKYISFGPFLFHTGDTKYS